MPPESNKLLILYSRLPDYFYQCLVTYTDQYDSYAVVVMYAKDVNAAYEYSSTERIKIYYKKDIADLPAFAHEYNPALIYVAGWYDKEYKRVAKAFKSKVPVITGLDNPWKGTMKQRAMALLSPSLIKPFFSSIWVAGSEQFVYAKQLGFASENILQGLYAADDARYNSPDHLLAIQNKRANYPRKILFTGRLVEYKKPHLLAKAFTEIVQESESKFHDWELIITGEGPLKKDIEQINNSQIKINGFIAPDKLPALYESVGVFCLPSDGEHWGVVVHEAALAGLPLLLSNSVSAGNAFLIHGHNGFNFKTKSYESFKTALRKIMETDGEALWQMGMRSKQLAKRITKETWAAELASTLK